MVKDNQELLGPPIQINIEISTQIFTQQIGEHFRGYAIVTAECGREQMQWLMLPGPYDWPKRDKQWEEIKTRWQAQLGWINRNSMGVALSLAESLIVQAYHDDEGVRIRPTGRKLQYTKRQAKQVKELLPERERFWREARRKGGLVERDGIWPSLIEAFEARVVTRKKAPKIIRPKWKSGQIALVHAAMDAGVTLQNYELLNMEQWRTVKRELVDREG